MKALLRQFSWFTVGQILAAMIQFLSLVCLARAVAPGVFGAVAAVVGLGIVLQAVLDLGLSRLIIREYASPSQREGLVAGAIRLSAWSSTALFLLAASGLLLAAAAMGGIYLELLPLAVAIAAEKNADTWIGVPIAASRSHVASTNLVLRRSIALAIFLILLAAGVAAVLAYAIGLAVGALFSLLFSRVFVSPLLAGWRSISAPEVLTAARPYYFNGVAVQVRNVDVFIISLISGATTAGAYAAAKRLSSPLLLVPTSLATVLLPAVARSNRESASRLLRRILYFSAASIVPYAIVWFLMPSLLPLVLGPAYSNAVGVAQILVASLPFAVTGTLLTSFLQGSGHSNVTARIAVLCTIYCLLGVFWGAFWWGALGAMLFAATTSVLQVLLQLVFIRFSLNSREDP